MITRVTDVNIEIINIFEIFVCFFLLFIEV